MPALKDPMREPPSPGATHNGDAIGTAHHTDADLPDHQNIIAAAGNSRAEDDLEDVGWKKNYDEIPRPLIRRLPNEQLWMLIRRFDMKMYHVKATDGPFPGGLDLNVSNEEEFSPDKLRVNVERLYMTVIIGMAAFAKHIARLRSWKETNRTAAFCAAYTFAWFFNIVIPLVASLAIALIVYPPSRQYLFPPVPLAIVSASSGGLQVPKANATPADPNARERHGELQPGSADSLTGAPETHKGEAVEQEASNFVASFASIVIGSVAGKGPSPEESTEHGPDPTGELDSGIPDPTTIASGVRDARKQADGDETHVDADKAKVPVSDAMWKTARPIMRMIGDIVDGWERWANALSPTPPFHPYATRVKIGAALLPLVILPPFVSAAIVSKAMGALIGFGFFGQPIITHGIHWLNQTYPDWRKAIDSRNTLMKGVPTDAQLTVTLLRVAEENKAPIPPPPTSRDTVEDKDNADTDLGEIPTELVANSSPEADQVHPLDDESSEAEDDGPKKHKSGRKLVSAIKGAARGTMTAVLGADRFKAAVTGSEASKQRLGAVIGVPGNETNNADDRKQGLKRSKEDDGPVQFAARLHGKKGNVYISTSATTPCVSFSTEITSATATVEKITPGINLSELKPQLSIALGSIRELRKIGGIGWKTKLVLGFALGVETAEGLEIVYDGVDGEGEDGGKMEAVGAKKQQVVRFMALARRDELFNRLIALGGHKWECW